MGFISKEIAIGFFISVIVTSLTLFLYTQYVTDEAFFDALRAMYRRGVLNKAIVLAAIPNLLIFFLFLKKQQDYRARGVFIATLVTAIVTIVLKFF